MKNKTYLVHFNYMATGEGATDSVGVVFAKNKKEAIRTFLLKTVVKPEGKTTADTDRAIDYFGACARAMTMDKTNTATVKELLSVYLSSASVESIIDAQKNHALHEFTFHVYRNYS